MSLITLAKTLSVDQKMQLLSVANECRLLGASSYELSPLFAVVYLSGDEQDPDEKKLREIIQSEYLD